MFRTRYVQDEQHDETTYKYYTEENTKKHQPHIPQTTQKTQTKNDNVVM